MNTATLLDHLRTHGTPLALSRAGVVTWDDAEFHRAAYEADPETYLLLALVPGVHEHQRARALLQTLSVSRAGLDEPTRATLDKATRALLFGLSPNSVITVLLALRHRRANHKHVTRAILTFVLDHPDAELLIAARRPALRDCLEHALGKNTARACAKRIAELARDSGRLGDTAARGGQVAASVSASAAARAHSGIAPFADSGEVADLHRKLLRFSANPSVAMDRVRQLYAPGTHGVPVLTEPIAPLEPVRQREPIVTVTNRGDIAATLVHIHRGGSAPELGSALADYVTAATGDLPRLPANVALVLDASESMRGYGDREWALLSQAEALRLVLAELCEHLTVIEVGASQNGPTDLATGLLDALDEHSDLVVIVTDGYENRLAGDLGRVVATLPRIGVGTPVVLCQTTFTGRDDLSLRDPAPALPHQRCWHQDDFAALLPWMFVRCPPGREWIRAAARAFLDGRTEGVMA